MKTKLPVLMNITRKYISIPTACQVICNHTSEAADKHCSFLQKAGGGIPLFDYKAPNENIKSLSKSKKIKAKQRYLESEVKAVNVNQTVISCPEVKATILTINKAVPLSKTVIKASITAVHKQCLQEVKNQYLAVFQALKRIQKDFHRGYRKNEYKEQGNIGVNCAWAKSSSMSKALVCGCY